MQIVTENPHKSQFLRNLREAAAIALFNRVMKNSTRV
jgi:hypothetical protein